MEKDAQGVAGDHQPVRSVPARSITIPTPSSTTIRKDAVGPGAMPGELIGTRRAMITSKGLCRPSEVLGPGHGDREAKDAGKSV